MNALIKLALVLICVLPSLGHALDKSKTQIIKMSLHPENSMFFASHENSLIAFGVYADPKVFGDLNRDLGGGNPNRIRKVPVSYFSELGLKEGVIIQNINVLNGGKKTTYTLKKEVNILLVSKSPFEDEEKNLPAWSKLNIILSDDSSDHKKLLRNNFNIITGFSYIGKNVTFNEGSEEKILLKAVETPNPVLKQHFASFSKKDNVKTAVINGHDVYVHIDHSEGNRIYTAFVKNSETTYVSIEDNKRIVTQDGMNLIVGPWVKDAKTLFYGESFSTDQCHNLVIFEKSKIFKVAFPCKDRED